MFKRSLILFLILASVSCTKKKVDTADLDATALDPSSDTYTTIVKDYFPNKTGCFLLYNMTTNKFDKVIGEETCKKRFPACSTFKIPLAVMAFDSGALKDENEVYKWDGKKNFLPSWNQDTDAKKWMTNSTVWFSQRLTPKIGAEKIKKYLKDFHYGNEDMSAGLTVAWLLQPNDPNGLKITAYEQTEFLKNLWNSQLPVSKRSMELAKSLTFLETSPRGFKLYGKTGSNFFEKDLNVRFGWFVSHVVKDDKKYIAITNFSDNTHSSGEGFGGMQAKEITKAILADQGLW